MARCAEEAQVHPSIIYGFYEYQTGNYQTPFKRYEPNAQAMLAKLNACNWDAESTKKNSWSEGAGCNTTMMSKKKDDKETKKTT
ncbi:MAG: hypothetical protein IPO17_17390, partial [Flavobacteriales bacterium]|nr:hypothetical protein [Flavobacteriales bacterium]